MAIVLEAQSKPKLPPFITKDFVLGLVVEVGGRCYVNDLLEYVTTKYESPTKNERDFIRECLNNLRSDRYLDSKLNLKDRNRPKDVQFWIRDEVKQYLPSIK